MFYEIGVKNTILDKNGNDKEVTNKYIVENQELFAEAEQKGLELPLTNSDVIAIKRSKIREFANEPTDAADEAIYIATIVDTITKDNGDEKKMKYEVALYAVSVTDANKVVQSYMAQGFADMECEGIKKTSFIEVI